MQFFVTDSKAFAQAVAFVAAIVPKKPSHPILGHIKIKADENGLELEATSLSLAAKVKVSSANVIQFGEICVPAKEFLAAAKSGIQAVESEDEKVSVSSAGAWIQLQGMKADEMPDIPYESNSDWMVFPSEELSRYVDRLLPAVSGDITKGVLTGINIFATDGKMHLASCDGHRIGYQTASFPCELHPFTIPSYSFKSLKALLKATKHIQFQVNSECITWQGEADWGKVQLHSRLLEGQYPAYKQLIPVRFEHEIGCDRAALISKLKQLKSLNPSQIAVRILGCHQAEFLLAPEGKSFDRIMATFTLPIEADKKAVNALFAFTFDYLLEALESGKSKQVTLKFNSVLAPFVLTGDESYQHLLMPVAYYLPSKK